MKRTIHILCLLLALLLLCSCSSKASDPLETAAPQQEVQLPDFTTDDCTFPLWECEQFRLDLIVFTAMDGELNWSLRGTPLTDETVEIQCDDIFCNDNIPLPSWARLTLENGEQRAYSISLTDALIETVPTKLSMLATATIGENTVEQELSWTQPEDFHPHPICTPFGGALALTRVLEDNERVKLTLLCLGNTYAYSGSYDSYENSNLGGILLVENKTDAAIPVTVCAASVNGRSARAYADELTLPANAKHLLEFSVDDFEYSDYEIDSVSEISLQILTDPGENTGMNYNGAAAGGSWYPVTLSQAGSSSGPEPGEVVFEDENLQISIIGFERGDISYSSDDIAKEHPENECTWKLMYVNKSEQDLKLTVASVKLNDEAYKYAVYFDAVNANSYTLDDLSIYIPADSATPEVSLQINVCTQGAGAILYSIEEPIVLPPEE